MLDKLRRVNRDVIERGVVPCTKCRKPHDCRRVGKGVTWADRHDGHTYFRMTAEQTALHFMARESGRSTVDRFAPALRRLARS